MVLTLDNVEEISEYFNATSVGGERNIAISNPWRLKANEIKQAMKLRVDFSYDEIRKAMSKVKV